MADDAPLNGAVFVAVGEDGLRMFSRDGRQWTHRQTGKEGEIFGAVCFGNGRCVVAGRYGGDNQFRATTDGVTWEAVKQDAQYSRYARVVLFFGGKFLAICTDSNNALCLSSTDGLRWEGSIKIPTDGKQVADNATLRRPAFGNDSLVLVGSYGRRVVTRDGVEWKNAPNRKAVDTLIDVTFGNGLFVGGGMHGLRMCSTDGLVWTDRIVGEEGEHINSMIWDGKQFVGIGQGATYFSPDGKQWERKPNQNAPTTAAFGNGVYVGSLWSGRLLRSADGIAWEEVTQVPQYIEALGFGVLGKPM